MKNIILLITLITSFNFYSQEYYVSAKSGLNVRNKPSLKAEKIGKLELNEKVKIIEETYEKLKIYDDNKEIIGYWVKIKNTNIEGYVFEEYLNLVKRHNLNFINFLKNKEFKNIAKVNNEWVKFSSMCITYGKFSLSKNETVIWFDTNDIFKRRIKYVEQLDNKTFEIKFLNGEVKLLKIIDSKKEIILFENIHYIPSYQLKLIKKVELEEDCG